MYKKFDRINVEKVFTVLAILQVMLILTIILNRVLIEFNFITQNKFNNSDMIFIFIMLIILITFFIIIFEIKKYKKNEIENTIQKEIIKNVKDLNNQMRSQRHDFLNHIQVIYSLIEMEEYEETRNYLHKVYGDIGELNMIIRTKDIAVNALLQAKYNDAKRKNIKFNIKITTNLEKIKIPSWELCRVFGNLIDNATYATLKYTTPQVEIELKEDLKNYIFIISNTCEKINIDMNKIFQVGFTTKNNEGEGMGLFIVKEILNTYNSDISVKYLDNLVTFIIRVPK